MAGIRTDERDDLMSPDATFPSQQRSVVFRHRVLNHRCGGSVRIE
jgi:hypothetical protein